MLPFLHPKKTATVIIARRGKPPGTEVTPEVEAPGHELPAHLKAAAEKLLQGDRHALDPHHRQSAREGPKGIRRRAPRRRRAHQRNGA